MYDQKRVFIKSLHDGENNDQLKYSCRKLKNFIADESSTYFRPGFKMLFPTYKRKKAKLISFLDTKFIELTSNTIRIIEDDSLKIEKELQVEKTIKDTIITNKEHGFTEEDEVILVSKHKENEAKIDFIYDVAEVISKVSFKITGRNYIPNDITAVKIIKRIDLKENFEIEEIKYITADNKILFINKLDKSSRTIYIFDDEKETFEKKVLTDLPDTFYPKVIAMYENRLILAQNNKLYLSRVDDLFNFKINTSTNYSSLMYEFNFGKKEEIHFCYPSLTTLIIGTNLNLYALLTEEGIIIPGKVVFKRISSYGAKDITPTSSSDDLIYVERGDSSIRLLTQLEKDESF